MKKTSKRTLSAFLAVIMLLSCFCVGASAEKEKTGYEALRISCTMYGDTQTQRGFTWYTEKECDSIIQIVPAADFDRNFKKADTLSGATTLFEGYYSHKVVVTGLEPGTTYYYRLGSLKNNIWSNIGKFVTDDGDGDFSFIALADVQASSLENFYASSLVMKEAMKMTPDAEFTVNLGDFVNDCTNEEWNWYGEAFQEANTNLTLVPVVGNHEGNITNKLNVGWFDNMFNLNKGAGETNGTNGTYYSFDYGNAHFCVANTNDMYPMTETQRNWIMNDLSNSDAEWKFLLVHRAAYSAGKNINKPDTLIMRETIIDIVDKTDVDMVLQGHDHMYYRSKQVAGDKVCEDVTYVSEVYNGTETVFAKDPDGAVYILPSTAGTKRYTVNEDAINPIMDCAAECFTTRDWGGCFSNIEINDGKLIYKAYVVDDETQEVTQVDQYAIMKTDVTEDDSEGSEGTDLPTDFETNLDASVENFVVELVEVLFTYVFKVLPQLLFGSLK